MHWVPIGAWIGAAVVALFVLGFCAYEISWKAKRLQRDLRKLQELNLRIAAVQADVVATQQRIAAAGPR
jgi:outer membrane murein-binding lipoprotein Lpp